jgi:hypothetical protein
LPAQVFVTAQDDQQQRSATVGWLLLLCDCERVLVTPGGAAGTSDGYARFM